MVASLALLVSLMVAEFAAQVPGATLHLHEGYRSQAVQDAYYAQGRLPLKEVNQLRKQAGLVPIGTAENANRITWTQVSKHTKGLAVDTVIHCHGVDTWDPQGDCDGDGTSDYEELGAIIEGLGLRWGGRWGDPSHAEVR